MQKEFKKKKAATKGGHWALKQWAVGIKTVKKQIDSDALSLLTEIQFVKKHFSH